MRQWMVVCGSRAWGDCLWFGGVVDGHLWGKHAHALPDQALRQKLCAIPMASVIHAPPRPNRSC